MLKRTLEYDFVDHVLAIKAFQVLSGSKLDYKQAMRGIAQLMLDDTWYIISKDAGDNGIPVLVFQKEGVNVLVAGAKAGELAAVVILATAGSKTDLAFAQKVLQKMVDKDCRLPA
nr:hypothetical protein [Candidatus Sigynarchaeota archaeon]